ncbi:MAG: family 20 glycosylhydrolase [Candidatus Acidiferrales bacterium]
MRNCFVVGVLIVFSAGSAFSQSSQTSPVASTIRLMPLPSTVQPGEGALAITSAFSVSLKGYTEPRLDRASRRFLHNLAGVTGLSIGAATEDLSKPALVVTTDQASARIQNVDEDESYTLEVTPTQATLHAANVLGTLHGLQTFLQLVQVTPTGFAAPAVHIEDRPRFPWRGLMIDSGRHFTPIDVLKRNIDGMEAVKLNVLHWHLSENQGFRVQSKTFPKLTEMGSDGLFYTQAEVREIIEYARDRGIRVMPEFDMPGHATAWFVGYPQIASGAGPYKIEREWGVFDPAMDPTNEATYKFLEKLLAEMTSLFPDAYFHIGGDEVNGKEWDANPKIQAFMKAHGLKNNHDLQQYFNTHVEKILQRHHKIMVGWDEILAPGLPKDSVVQSWRGQNSLAEAIKLGYRGLLSYGYYLDMMSPASKHYLVDPMAQNAALLSDDEKKRILGGEACMWSEYITPEDIDSRIWPRTAAIAERLWSPQSTLNVESMYVRLGAESRRLEALGLTHRASENRMLRRLAGTEDIAALRVLADVVEPVKEYDRENLHGPGSIATPLDRIIDAIPPESEVARRFATLVDQFIAANLQDAALEKEIRSELTVWSQNHDQLQPLFKSSFIVAEAEPVSQNLSALANTGLQALDYIDKREPAPAPWTTQQLQIIKQAGLKKADLLLMIGPSIQQLVEASGNPVSK